MDHTDIRADLKHSSDLEHTTRMNTMVARVSELTAMDADERRRGHSVPTRVPPPLRYCLPTKNAAAAYLRAPTPTEDLELMKMVDYGQR